MSIREASAIDRNDVGTPKVPLVYVTCCDNGLFGLDYLHKREWPIARVITLPPDLGRKYAVAGYVDVSAWCHQRSVDLTSLGDYHVDVSDVRGFGDAVLVVNGWNRLISPAVINSFPTGALGIHAGHPPIGLGRAPLPWNIIRGFRDIEVYVFRLTERADDGDILAQAPVEITGQDTVKTLYEKVMFRGAVLFEAALKKIRNGERGTPQDLRFAVHYPKRTPEDGAIDFRQPVEEIADFVRAQTRPYPGAFATLDDQRWSIWSAQPFDQFAFRDAERVPGRIVLALPSGLVVQTGSSPLWITSASVGELARIPAAISETETLIGKVFTGRV